jgi:NAD(P)-dependent dehydrogenase (short-subunit alcohol dehydrogenase family)
VTGWTGADMLDQSGRTVVVTGANSGIGAVTAAELSRHGAHVVLACRDTAKGDAAAARMTGDVEVRALDLSDLASVRAFAADLGPVDVLVNNAGVMATPLRRTAQGFELQIGTNHLGPFLLTSLLEVRDRVVTVSSAGHRLGRIDLADLNWERRRYGRWRAYGQSKLANLLFTYELQRRHEAGRAVPQAFAAHPGYAKTGLTRNLGIIRPVVAIADNVIGQSAEHGALPTLYAATMDLPGGAYVGPDGPGEQRGYPRLVSSNGASHDVATARALWSLSADLVGV